MKMESFAGIAVTSMVIILMVVSVLVPMIQNTDTTTYVESDNEGFAYKMTRSDGTYDRRITLTTVGESSATYTIGASGTSTGTTKTISGDDNLTWISDNTILTLTSAGMHVLNANVGNVAWNATSAGDYAEYTAGSMKIVRSPGENQTQRTSPYTWVMAPDDNGSWAWFDGSFNASKATKMYAVWWSSSGANATAGFGTATSMAKAVAATGVTAAWTVDYSDEGTYYAVNGATVTYNSTSGSALGFAAPISYTSGTDGTGSIVTDLLNIIPILIIVGIILAIVGLYLSRRDY